MATNNNPTIVVIKGDGSARTLNGVPGLTDCALQALDAAVELAYNGQRKIMWQEALAGESAREKSTLDDAQIAALSPEEQQKIFLPQDTIDAIKEYHVALKGPLATPTGGGFKSINVTLRQMFDLYACVRPVKYVEGAPTPNKNVEKHGLDMVIFRENVEDVYAGIEFKLGSPEQKKLEHFLRNELGVKLHPEWNYGIGIKPISEQGTKRLVRRAVEYAQEHGYKTVTIMHKGNIMKYTEGAFRDWAYEVGKESGCITEEQLWKEFGGKIPDGKIVMNDRIADNMLQQVQIRPERYGVIVCPNLNGDYLSDDLAALVGGLGIAPGANIGDKYAIFEATHGTAPDLVGQDKANPTSIMLSGAMMLDYLGWKEAGDLLRESIESIVSEIPDYVKNHKKPLPVTCDLAMQVERYTAADGIKCSEYTRRVVESMCIAS